MKDEIQLILTQVLINTEHESQIDSITDAILQVCMVELNDRAVPYAKSLLQAALDEYFSTGGLSV